MQAPVPVGRPRYPRVRRLREAGNDEPLMRIDTLCRRPVEETTILLSRSVAAPVGETATRRATDPPDGT